MSSSGHRLRACQAVFVRGGKLVKHPDEQPLQFGRLAESPGGISLQDRREQHLEPAVLDERIEDVLQAVLRPPKKKSRWPRRNWWKNLIWMH